MNTNTNMSMNTNTKTIHTIQYHDTIQYRDKNLRNYNTHYRLDCDIQVLFCFAICILLPFNTNLIPVYCNTTVNILGRIDQEMTEHF